MERKKRKDWTQKQKERSENDLRSKDVAHILDCSPDDVIMLARHGKLGARKEGRFWRFTIADVKQYQNRK